MFEESDEVSSASSQTRTVNVCNGLRDPDIQAFVRFRALFFLVAVSLVACKEDPKSTRWEDAAAAAATQSAAAPRIESGSLNKFFPKEVDGAKVVFSADKEGYAEAKASKDGAEVATLSIADSASDDAAKKKFEGASEKIDGHPLNVLGKTQSSVLVHDRFQVKVSSKTLDADARKRWLSQFDLAGLSKL